MVENMEEFVKYIWLCRNAFNRKYGKIVECVQAAILAFLMVTYFTYR